MRKTMLPIAITAILLTPLAAAAADVKVYGKFNIALEAEKDQIGLDKKTLERSWFFKDQNNSSRIGVKGSEDLGLGDLKALFQLEWGIDTDGSEAEVLTRRNLFFGLQGGFGTAKFGIFDTPLKAAGERIDLFNDESIEDDASLLVGETRQKNMLQYATPPLFDVLSFTVAVTPGEDRVAVDDIENTEHGVADTVYASLVYEQGSAYASASYAWHEVGSLKFDGPTAAIDIVRGAVDIKPIAALELGALIQQARGVDQDGQLASGTPPVLAPSPNAHGHDAKETSYLASVGYTIDTLRIKGQLGETRGELTHIRRDAAAVGFDYKLSKTLITQVYYIRYVDHHRVVNGIGNPETSDFGVGMSYSF